MGSPATKQNFSSHEFLARLRKRDHDAIETLVRIYTQHLFRAALGLGFAEDAADELVQNTWNAFLHSVPKFEGRSHVRTYLFGILYNKASETYRERGRTSPSEKIDQIADREELAPITLSTPPADPEAFLIGAQTGEIIEACLDALPLRQKTAFLLKTVEGNSTDEICKIMDISVTNLGVLIHRAKNNLRDCVTKKQNGDNL